MFNNYPLQQEQDSHAPKGELVMNINIPDKSNDRVQWLDTPSPKRKKNIIKPNESKQIQNDSFEILKLLEKQLESSNKKMKRATSNAINEAISKIENSVYHSETTPNKDLYLEGLSKDYPPNKYLKEQINETIKNAHKNINKQIKSGNKEFHVSKRKIPKSKDEVKELQKLDHYRYLKLKEGQVRGNLSTLREEIQEQYYRNKIRTNLNVDQVVEKNYYSIDHPRTKQAEDFVKQIQSKRMEQKRQYELYLTQKRQKQQYDKQKQVQKRQMERMERKSKLHEYYQSKLQEKMEQRQRQKRKKQQYKQWIKAYQRERPLELEKQEEFKMKVLIPEMEEKHKKLMTIKAERRPIDVEQLIEHEMKYLQFKKDDQIRKRAQLEMINEEDQMHKQDINDRLYKGKFRYLALEQMIDEKSPINVKDVEQSKKDRIRAYAEHIRNYQKQAFQNLKSSQIQGESIANKRFTRRVRGMNGSMTISNKNDKMMEDNEKEVKSERQGRKNSDDLDAHKHGLRNLAFLKSKIRQQMTEEQVNKPLINFVQQNVLEKPKGFLELQREKKMFQDNDKKPTKHSMMSKEIQKTAASTNEDIMAVKAKADMLDQNLKRQEIKVKNANLAQEIQNGAKLEQHYVDAIKAKIHLINNFD